MDAGLDSVEFSDETLPSALIVATTKCCATVSGGGCTYLDRKVEIGMAAAWALVSSVAQCSATFLSCLLAGIVVSKK